MKEKLQLLFCSLMTCLTYSQQQPVTKKIPTTISKHGITFTDNYSWLEKMRSDEVTNWVDTQNKIMSDHFKTLNNTDSIAAVIKEYDTKTTYKIPERKGKYFFSLYRKEAHKSGYLFYRKDLNEKSVELVNPNTIYEDKNVAITNYYPSKSSKLLAYKINIDGSDRHEIRFVDLDKRTALTDDIKNVKFSNVSWNKDNGIFYKKNSNKEQFAKDSTYQLFYHKIGTLQENDDLVFDSSKSESDFDFFTSKDKLFIIETSKDETLKNYYYAELNYDVFQPKKFIENDSTDFKLLSSVNDRIYFSSKKYNWGEIRSFPIANRNEETVVVPQIFNNLLVKSYFYNDYIVCRYKTTGKNYFIIYDYTGKFIRKTDAPKGMEIDVTDFNPKTKELYYGLYSYIQPYQNIKLNVETGTEEPFYSASNRPKPTLFPLNHFEIITTTYKSRDNVDIPIIIVAKKGIPLDGNNPTLLKAYGGFGTISPSSYDTCLLYFLEKGGVFAYAEIRGGGEKGLKWHTDGKGQKKINTFNDFIDAAEYLINNKYTSPNRLAITGGSQGGLLVGVAMTKRPELFKVAIPNVGVFDMNEFNKYTVGKYHLDEYGDPNVSSDYKAMMAYSPYHNIKENINYPITLIITSENDDRVPPFQSYKFAALLQNRAAQKNPVYIKTLKKAGHAGKNFNYDDRIEEKSALYSFLLYHLNK